MSQAGDEGVERGPLGLKDRSALRDDRYRRWYWGTGLAIGGAWLATPMLVLVLDISTPPTTADYVYATVSALPLTLAYYLRAVMHVRLKAALVGTTVSKYSINPRHNLTDPDPIESERESVRIGSRLALFGTILLFIPPVALVL